jgi:hypothetical protein
MRQRIAVRQMFLMVRTEVTVSDFSLSPAVFLTIGKQLSTGFYSIKINLFFCPSAMPNQISTFYT